MKYKFSRENLTHISKVFAWSAVSAVLGVVITTLSQIEFPTQYMFLVSIINTLLVAAKEYTSEQR